MWVVASPEFCLFHAADTRSRAELESLLGIEYRGVISSDDFSVYNGYRVAAQQKCLAHLRRHFLRLLKSPGRDNASIAQVFVDLIDNVFANYRSLQLANDLDAYRDWATQFKLKLTQAFSLWIPKAGATARHLLSKLRHQEQQWWYCLDHPEVPRIITWLNEP